MGFLPVTKQELNDRGIDAPDFVLVCGDAYVDHPSFGHAVIGRIAESFGFSVAVLAQPQNDNDYKRFGAPLKGFLVSGGVVDSMVNNYSVAKNRRDSDDYSDEGKAGLRPDRNVAVYCKALKRLYPDVPVIAGGIEASLRRLSHYDYWSDSVMNSILIDAPADLIIYGMGENPMTELLEAAKKNIPLNKLKNIRGTAYLTDIPSAPQEIKDAIEGKAGNCLLLSSHDRVKSDKKLYCKAFMVSYENTDPFFAKTLIQKQDYVHYAVVNPPAYPLSEKQMDSVYGLEYMRAPHPMYKHVPAIEEVKFSVTAHRGCYGNCSFCAITYHQGKLIQKRSADNIVEEVGLLAKDKDFKGYIHDIGGPSANFHCSSCDKNASKGACKDKDCIGYETCKNLKVDHSEYLDILRRARRVPGVKKVFIRSGIRYDYLLADKDKTFFKELIEHHISGQLKVAPEHIADKTLKLMNKPPHETYEKFCGEFYRLNKEAGKNQFLVPYLISSHPGCTISDAVKLTEYLIKIGYMPQQVQDFYPTPSTLSTTMYYTGLDPRTLEPVYTAKTAEEKAMQRALLQYRLPKNRGLIEKALKIAGREDLMRTLSKYYKSAGK